MEVRERRPSDVEGLRVIAEASRALDGYPPRTSGLFESDDALGAWVTLHDGRVVGHVALLPDTSPKAMELAMGELRLPAGQLGVVARLVVSPEARRRGAGRELLRVAVEAAHLQGRWPILDVGQELESAIALYEACGWTRVGSVTFRFRDGPELRRAQSFVYVGPAPKPSG